ncbi:PhnA-like protein [Lichenihabitans sp. Uapishka_5]|uniref:PhnA-like protein n=1 Tax=Lichenihabitans sp. Uapishka_5 TaxID=3037302 RepID=UPI0029E80B06|nr:PhnA-like protein [Lichenihabitans sp. Uapishka_5]MDX7951365.1 PhnA-like protein [Lichenihabitans sp. Uapishka_5]
MTALNPAHGRSDLPHLTPTTPAEEARTVLINNLSWSAIFAGVAVALVTLLLLNLLGLGLGMSSVTPSAGDNPAAATLSIGAGLWYVVASLIAAFLGGHAAARLSGRAKASTAAWHGVVSWAVTTLFVLYLLTTAVGGLMGGAFSAVTGAAGGLGHTAATVAGVSTSAGADPFSAIENQIGNNDAATPKTSAIAAVKAAVAGDQAQADQAREGAAQALAKAQNIPVDEARARVGQYQQQYRQTVDQAKQKAIQAADTAATVVSRGALFGFLALVLGALAGWFGGRSGEVKPTFTGTEVRTTRI